MTRAESFGFGLVAFILTIAILMFVARLDGPALFGLGLGWGVVLNRLEAWLDEMLKTARGSAHG